MRLSDILLISLMLLTASGAYDGVFPPKRGGRLLSVAILAALLLLSGVRAENAFLSLHAASLVLPLLLLVRVPWSEWGGMLIVSLFGGMLAWKLSTSYPLFPEQGLLQSIVFVSLACIYCRDIRAKLFAVACAAIGSGLFLFLQDVLLFGYGRVYLGSPELFDAQVVSLYCLLNLQAVLTRGIRKRPRSRPVGEVSGAG